MKKRSLVIGLLLMSAIALNGCGKKDEQQASNDSNVPVNTATTEVSTEVSTENNVDADVIIEGESTEGKVISDLTGEYIDASLENQRPVAIIVDNEKIALPHYGLTEADIIYEMVNSTQNNRVTRLMALVKDWKSIERIGSIRSARTTNCMVAMEWNAVLCHDGGPFYINDYTALPSLDNISGGFARIDNGKSREFTEYITTGELASRFKSANIETEYNNHYVGPHFTWSDEVDLTDGKEASYIGLPFPHNDSELEYDAEDGLYYYSEYGKAHVDPGNGNKQLSFKNVIIQSAKMYEHDENGYMYYKLENSNGEGYYAVNGEVVPITWKKSSLTSPTKYYDANGNELVLNTGKTYIAIVPSDAWNNVVLK